MRPATGPDSPTGRRLFEDTETRPLELTHHEVLDTGVLHLTYAPAS